MVRKVTTIMETTDTTISKAEHHYEKVYDSG